MNQVSMWVWCLAASGALGDFCESGASSASGGLGESYQDRQMNQVDQMLKIDADVQGILKSSCRS